MARESCARTALAVLTGHQIQPISLSMAKKMKETSGVVATYRGNNENPRNSRQRDQNFGPGSIFALSVSETVDIAVAAGTELHINTCSWESGSAVLTLCYKPSFDNGSNDEDGKKWISLCHVHKQDTVTGLGLTCDGPRKFSLQVGGNRGTVSVFGSIGIGTRNHARDLDNLGIQVQGRENVAKMALTAPKKSERVPNTPQQVKQPPSEEESDTTAPKLNSSSKRKRESPNNKKSPVSPPVHTENDDAEPKEEDMNPPQPMSKKQRRKLAKQKTKELEALRLASSKKDDTKKGPTTTTTTTRPKETQKKAVVKERRLPGGIFVKDLVLGEGSLVKPGRKVSILYEGSFPSGEVFDKNHNRKSPLTFRQGTGQVVKGLEKGLEGMRVGGMRRVTIPPQLAYGKKGSGNVIPPNATLVFVVDLVRVGG